MTMAISEQDYNSLKEYWDYQRKVEYNRERTHYIAEQFELRIHNQYGPIPVEEIKDMLWTKMPTSEYEDPPKGYIPENPSYRLWNETWPPALDWKKNDDNDI